MGIVLELVRYSARQQPPVVYWHGKATDGTQRYRCTNGRHTFQLRCHHRVHEPGVRARTTDLALNGSGVRATARMLIISP